MKILLRVASASNLEDASVTDALFATESWQTLMTFARESARKYSTTSCIDVADDSCFLAAHPSAAGPASGPSHPMDEDIPAELYEQFAREDAGGSGPTVASNIRICPHCTFENTHGGSDCEVCVLPL